MVPPNLSSGIPSSPAAPSSGSNGYAAVIPEPTAIASATPQTTSVRVVCETDVGRERAENQDAWGFVEQGDLLVLIVCDGMGGHNGGSTAARLAVQTIEHVLAESTAPVTERIDEAIRKANKRIYRWSRRDPNLSGMGTTVVLIAVDKSAGRAYMAHVGDSRGYRLRDDVFERLTRDHTMVQRLVDDGLLTPEAAENHPHSNIISRSLGGGDDVEVEHYTEELILQPGDLFLLCSDGLTGMVPEGIVPRYLARHDLDALPRVLIDEANAAGGLDNITVGLLLVGAPPPPRDHYSLAVPRSLRARPQAEASRTVETLQHTARTKPHTLTGPAGDTLMITTPEEGLRPPPPEEGAVPPPGADLETVAGPDTRPDRGRRDATLILVSVVLLALIAAVVVGLLMR